jgi:hypothetical protein
VRISLEEGRKKRNRARRGTSRSKGHRSAHRYDSAVAVSEGLRRRQRPGSRPPAVQKTARKQADVQRPTTRSRPTTVRRVRKWKVARPLAALVLLLSLAAILFLTVSPDFYVYSAEIAGNEYVDGETILLAAGIKEQHILWIWPGEVAKRIEALDGIKAATVSSRLPARVSIAVEERKPVLRWYTESQRQEWCVDEEGIVLPYPYAGEDTLVVVDMSGQVLAIGDRIKPENVALSLAHLRESLPGLQILYYYPDRGLSFTWKAKEGEWPVYLGSSDDLERKLEAMEVMTGFFEKEGIRPRFLDVSRPEYPVYGKPEASE